MDRDTTTSRRRMSHDQRHAQLLQTAREFIRDEGSDALTLARLAERAGVAKPLVYQHFGTKSAVLAELYQEFKHRTHVTLDAALTSANTDLDEVAGIIADAYIDCIDTQDTELPGITGALSGSPEMELLREHADAAFSERCREALVPFAHDGTVRAAGLYAMLGAADALARAIVLGQITSHEGREALARVVASTV